MNVREKASAQPIQQEPTKWGLVTYRVKFNLWNVYLCVDDVPTTDLAEAERKLAQVCEIDGVTLARIEAVRDKM